jgi:hypothetical protein
VGGLPRRIRFVAAARDLLQETINEVEKEFGGTEASDFPLPVDAGILPLSVDQLVAERAVFNSAPSTVLDASEWISDDFIIVSTQNTRQAGQLYIICHASQSKDKSVLERRIPPNRHVQE